MKFSTVKGMRDFYPTEMALRNWVMAAWRRVSLRNGFEEYDGPIFEYLDLYKAKSGEGIVSELFHFTDRGDRELAIRPEMTPTLARMINARAAALPRPIKWFSMPRLCRAERPQRGRQREFFQWNIDIVGIDDVLADAECIFVALDFFREVGLRPADMVMKINSRSLLSALLKAWDIETTRHAGIFVVLDKRDKLPDEVFQAELAKICRDDREKNMLLTLGQAQGQSGMQSLAELAQGNETAEAEMAKLNHIFNLLAIMGVADYCTFDMSVVRGLAYYTGVVFEGFGRGGLRRAICGGGRYDDLLKTLGGPAMSGIGFGTSDVVILDLLQDLGRLDPAAGVTKKIDFFIVDADPELLPNVLELVSKLREKGIGADFSYRRQALGKQLKQADAVGARRAVILGSEFRQGGHVVIKDLATGRQSTVSLADFLSAPLA